MPAAPVEKWSADAPDGRHLAATYYIPAAGGHQWAILVHGYGRDQRYARDYAEAYLEKGYKVLTPDLCASGESEGQYITMGVKESAEVALWAAKIKERDPEAEIVLHGVSMGAATVMLAAGCYDVPGLKAVIEDCGYTSAYEMFSAQLKQLFGLPAFPIMPCVNAVSRIETGAWLSDAAPINRMPGLPTLFIHGDADKLAPVGMAYDLYTASEATGKELLIVPGVGHADAKTDAQELYYSTVFTFLESLVVDIGK